LSNIEDARPGGHPYVCPQCSKRVGVYDVASGTSTCASCGHTWRGPRVAYSRPPLGDEAALDAWAQSVVDDVLGRRGDGRAPAGS
jgi:ribosomal protein L37AE/L43A